jgi:hypothetical protein
VLGAPLAVLRAQRASRRPRRRPALPTSSSSRSTRSGRIISARTAIAAPRARRSTRLAAAGARFTTVVSPTSWTLPAHVTLLTALPPEVHGVERGPFRIGSGVTTLAQVLHQRGYATAGFVSGPYLDAGYGFARGFDHYDDYSALRISSWAVHRAHTSPALVDSTTRWLAEWHDQPTRRPFFVFLHMWDVHYDFNPPPPYDTMFDPDYRGTVTTEDFETGSTVHAGMDPRDLEHVVALYDGEIRYTDEHLGRLIDVLRRLGRARRHARRRHRRPRRGVLRARQQGSSQGALRREHPHPARAAPSRPHSGRHRRGRAVRLADVAPTILASPTRRCRPCSASTRASGHMRGARSCRHSPAAGGCRPCRRLRACSPPR